MSEYDLFSLLGFHPNSITMIQFHQLNNGFVLSFQGVSVVKHTQEQPWICVGRGTGNFTMVRGNFQIKEELYDKIALDYFNIQEQAAQRVLICFGTRQNPQQLVVNFEERAGRLAISLQSSDNTLNRCWLRFCARANEHLYGCGEQFSVLDLKGRVVPLWVEEPGVGRGPAAEPILAAGDIGPEDVGNWYTTYYPQPTFVSSSNYFYHLESSAYAAFDFSEADTHLLHIWEIPQTIIFDTCESSPATLQSLSEYSGRQPVLPDWVYDGVWLGIQGGQQKVQHKIQSSLSAGVKVCAVWVQDWEGRRVTAFGKQLFWDWKYDQTLYPDLPIFIEQLNQQGIKFTGYINSFLALEGELYREASQKGYLVKQQNGTEYHVVATTFPAALVDFSNPEAVIWLKEVIKKNMIEIGLAGWMADYCEYLPTDAALASGENAELYHNRYPVDWARLNLEAIQEAGKAGEIVFFTRSGYTGLSRYSTLVWNGDQLVDWSLDDGLATVIPASLSLGFCGIGYIHSDTGGFTTLGPYKRSKELFMRWAEHTAFTPIMRTHEGNRPDDNWQFDSDADTLAHFARMSQIHVRLKPYLLHAAQEYQETGLPLVRHPYLHYEGDAQLHELQYQYLLGRDLLVAPVYKPDQQIWTVYLPDDRWGYLWNGQEYGQGWHTVDAPLGQPPVFYRLVSDWVDLFRSLCS